MIAMQSAAQREILYDSPWVSWERMPAGDAEAWIQQIKFYDRWLFLVTDEAGRNYRDCAKTKSATGSSRRLFP